MRGLIEALAGSAPDLGLGFQAFSGPEPGKGLGTITVRNRMHSDPSLKLNQLIKRLRSKVPTHLTKRHAQGRIPKHR